MRTTLRGAVAALATLAALSLASAPSGADDKKPPAPWPDIKPADAEKPPAVKEVPLVVLSDADAAPLIEGLKKAGRTRNAVEAMPALDAIGGKTHKEFETPLVKLATHLSSDVAARAVACLGERGGEKTPGRLWNVWSQSITKDRYDVKGAILAALGRLGSRLDAKQYDEVESLWRKAPNDDALIGVARYFEATKTDKRPCRLFAEFLNEPRAGDVNSPTNPPASYWEARWKQWKAVCPSVQDALKAITGQMFDNTEDAKKWFKANEKTFGFVW
jgi:hypothetical protein